MSTRTHINLWTHNLHSIFNLGNQYHVARMQTKFCLCCPDHIKGYADLLRRVNKQYANIGKPGPSQSCNISSCFHLVSAAWPPHGARLPMLGTLPDLSTCFINRQDRSSLLVFLPPENRWLWLLSHVKLQPYWNSDVSMAAGVTERTSRLKCSVRRQTSGL